MRHPLPVAERLTNLEITSLDHGRTLATINQALAELKESEAKRQISDAVAIERALARGEQLRRIEEDIATFKSAASKLLWIVVGSVVLAFLAWIYKGGLTL